MIEQVHVVAHGRPATEALTSAIDRVKAGRALAPVTVVVPSNYAGLAVRRLLGAGLGGAGIANVAFVTPFRLAELLAADQIRGRRPLTTPVLAAAVRRVLATDPGELAPVAAHHATENALVAMYAELSHVSEHALEAFESAGPSATRGTRLFRQIGAQLRGFHDEDDVAAAAADRSDLDQALVPLGHLVWYLPEALTPALTRLMRNALARADATAVVGITGVPDADDKVIATCNRAGLDVAAEQIAPIEVPTGSAIISVTDPDEEVRAVIRRVAELAEEGVRLDRIGVFYPTPDPYVRILGQQFEAAAIPSNGPSRERLGDSVAGATLRAALSLPAQRWRRDRVMALVSGAPIRHGDGRAFPTSWETLSRRAGIVQDLGDWRRKLSARVDALGDLLDQDEPEDAADPERADWIRRDREDTEALLGFVDALAAGVRAVDDAQSWVAKTDATRALLHQLLGPGNRRGNWPEHEQRAADRVEDVLARLAALDEIDPAPSPDVFRRALEAELEIARGRTGRFGEGVAFGSLASAVGQDFDAVFVLGLAEGQCPAPRRDDALLPDVIRSIAGGHELATASTGLREQQRRLLAALASAPNGERWLTFPRGDLRSGRRRLASRWLLDTASALAGRRVHSTDFADLGAPVVDVVASFADGVGSARVSASPLDHELTQLYAFVAAGGAASAHPAAAAARRGFECLAARRSSEFTIWDGNLAGCAVPSPARGQVLSATRLERWATCGFRYFLADVLGLRVRDDPERIVELSALDRGSAVHAILERFFLHAIETGPPEPDVAWSAAEHERLHEIADEVFAEYETTGRTGRPVHWRLNRERLGVLLDDFLRADDEYRAQMHSRPQRVEFPFGFEDDEPVSIDLGDDRKVLFRGMADRVDVTADGDHVVFDYKTGKGRQYDKIEQDDPVMAGTTLQLGLYSEAALQRLGARSASGYYWLVNSDAKFARKGYEWSADRRTRFLEVVKAIVDGIEAGVFAPVPGEFDSWRQTHENCTYCDFDDVCLRDRGEQAGNKAASADLGVRDVLNPRIGGNE